jgi:prepilin-type N-terminal cleavage/methylation domain-containing protein
MKRTLIQRNPIVEQKGFTLVEVIAVLVILAIFATTAIAKYSDVEDSARRRKLEASVMVLNAHVRHSWYNSQVVNGVGSYLYYGATLGDDVTVTGQEAGKEPSTGLIYLNRDAVRYRLEWTPGPVNGHGSFALKDRI